MRAAALLLLLGAGCQIVVNTDDLNNHQCRDDQKQCGTRCVSKDDPGTGCGDPLMCAPCSFGHGVARCSNELVCERAGCSGAYRDCFQSPENDCETDTAHDPDHCGGCDAGPCKTINGYPGCSAGTCSSGGCLSGWEDCNGDFSDGCERRIDTNTDCGGCDAGCSSGTSCVAQSPKARCL